MNESSITSSFQFARPVSDQDISEITHQISELEGVDKVKVSELEMTITYDGYVQTDEVLKQHLEDAGYTFSDKRSQSKKWFQKMVDYLSKGNKEAFKDGQPSCCNPDLPRQT